MAIRFWLSEEDEILLSTSRKYNGEIVLSTRDYIPGLLEGEVEDGKELRARTQNENFVLGAVRPWNEIRDSRCLYVLVEETPLTSGQLVISNYSGLDVRFHKGLKLISQKRDVERTELLSGSNFVDRAFTTFDLFFSQRSKKGYSPRFVLYDPDGQIDNEGNMANPIDVKESMAILAQRRKMK